MRVPPRDSARGLLRQEMSLDWGVQQPPGAVLQLCVHLTLSGRTGLWGDFQEMSVQTTLPKACLYFPRCFPQHLWVLEPVSALPAG